jgi:hypothetical protein
MGSTRLLRGLALAFVAALVAAASGCGGKARLDRTELLHRANAICRAYSQKQNDVQVPSVNPIDPSTSFTDRARWGAALNQIALLGHQEVIALRTLRPPKEAEARFEKLLDEKDAAFDKLNEDAKAALRDRPARVKTIGRAARAQLARVRKLATEFGVPKCG